MLDITGLPENPAAFVLIAVLFGFGLVALAKLYGLFFMRWRTPFRVGQAMNVRVAEVTEWSGDEGYVSADGELWRATSKDELHSGDKVSIRAVNGLLLTVKKRNA